MMFPVYIIVVSSLSPGVGKLVDRLPEVDTKDILENLMPDLNGDTIIAHGNYNNSLE
jgi:hypothetical protein